jgi:hypothetical protein
MKTQVLLQKYKSSKSRQPVLLRILEQCSLYNHSPLLCSARLTNRCQSSAVREPKQLAERLIRRSFLLLFTFRCTRPAARRRRQTT